MSLECFCPAGVFPTESRRDPRGKFLGRVVYLLNDSGGMLITFVSKRTPDPHPCLLKAAAGGYIRCLGRDGKSLAKRCTSRLGHDFAIYCAQSMDIDAQERPGWQPCFIHCGGQGDTVCGLGMNANKAKRSDRRTVEWGWRHKCALTGRSATAKVTMKLADQHMEQPPADVSSSATLLPVSEYNLLE